jgi:ABC-type multidrug transport system fused ATPase/permease subunit
MRHARGRNHAARPPTLTGLLGPFLRPHAGQVGLVLVLLTVQTAGNLYLPILTADIIDYGIVNGDTSYIWRTGGLMLGVALAVGILSIVTVYRASRVSMNVGAGMRVAIYRRVQDFSAREMGRFGIPSLITRNTNDVQQVQMFLQVALTMLVPALIMSVGGVILATREGAALSLLLGIAVPVTFVVIGTMVVMVMPLFGFLQVKVDRINQVLREQISGARVIRAFGRARSEQGRLGDVNADLASTMLRFSRIFAAALPMLTAILTLSSVAAIWFGGRVVSEGSMPIGNLTAFLAYIVQILLSVVLVVGVVAMVPRATVSAKRIGQVLNTTPVITEPARVVIPARVTGAVEFRHLTFGYPGSERPVLRDLTFVLPSGKTSAIIGGTGSGKTTLLSLVPRFLDAADGAVLVDEIDVREQSPERLRSTIGLVPQAAFLFCGTVASNLRFAAPDATEKQLWHALDVAQARDFVVSMPGQLDARIDQGGVNLSGGQRQRLSIARALVRRPSLYLFDDCFSALDAATDARLRHALRAETGDANVVIAAQRVSTVMHADQIIVLDAGRIIGIGTHEQLLDVCGPYREIAISQLGARGMRKAVP